ncbi:uncharacterized protein LY89DRAFT_598871 [Mollisia scopiformis]|uniref:GST N-terminal domain-containing protein n=1 Tax=Mollisia scopiformis TaxID=149040 RepID=A0A132B966_MOLSC|nr:uncharacterized protein LY89DRAFT_598871 [Mollisia scopiformis]KUJ08945.1 hypothetical protein LY89DRAFT_598871 [Mollisia scopiformis]
MASTEPYTLYYNKWSICSQMVQLTFAFRGEPKDAGSQMTIEKKSIDIMNGEQLEEAYLTEINPKGQVPVLTHPSRLPKPIADSLDITYYITTQYPGLVPESNKDQLIELLKELHRINFFSLSFGSRVGAVNAQKTAVEAKLAQTDISAKYRKALEYKKTIIRDEKVNGVTPEEIETQKSNTTTFLDKIAKLYNPGSGPWLWGRISPTVLDVQLAIFLARLHDVGHAILIPKHLLPFYSTMTETNEWKDVYQGRKTMFGV